MIAKTQVELECVINWQVPNTLLPRDTVFDVGGTLRPLTEPGEPMEDVAQTVIALKQIAIADMEHFAKFDNRQMVSYCKGKIDAYGKIIGMLNREIARNASKGNQ